MLNALNRRTAILTGTAALLAPAPAFSAESGVRSFRVARGGSDIGYHRVSVSRTGDTITANTDIAIAVKFLGITAYRYELAYTEVYQNGLLQRFDATSNDDGDRGFVRAVRTGDALQIDGSGYSGPAPGGAVPTSYWRQGGLKTAPWISAQDGELLPVGTAERSPLPQTPVGSRVWRATDNAEYTVDIWYDAAGDWTGCAFDAGGELGVYTLEPGSTSLLGFAA